ncbi:hypothetical protein F4804DRAFT_318591 [Jackrogersella minutella]|nr:hypothetical protein F4804DRAFT_318591 [Jackrogersella minutella]
MSSHSHSSLTMFPTSKRSACDRCRSQKLRCPPRDHVAQSCSRCTRLGAHCVTSLDRPLGCTAKRRLRGSLGTLPQPELRPRSTESNAVKPMFTTRPSLSTSSQSIASCDEGLSAPINASQDTSHDITGLFSPRSLEAYFSDDIQFSGGSHNEEAGDGEFPGFKESYTISCSPVPNDKNNAGSELAFTDMNEKSPQFSDNCISEQTPYILQCDERLARLNLRLSTRLQEHFLASKSHDSNTASCSPSQESTSSEATGPSNTQALGDILRDTAEFTSIVESYNPRRKSMNSIMSERLEPPTTRPRLSTIVQLDLISAYLQIVATYDNLLQYLCSHFCTNDSPPSSPLLKQDSVADWFNPFGLERLQPLPGMQVAGFQVHQGTLQAKLLLDTILHHLVIVERLLGLPKAWRATDKYESHSIGIFADARARLILDAIGLSNLEQSSGALSSNGELPTIASLRDGIKRLQVFID